jgi:hypothetical protein
VYNSSSLGDSSPGIGKIGVALLTALALSLFALVVFEGKYAEAQSDLSVKVDPIKVDVGDIAVGQTDSTSITLTNNGNSDVEVGSVDLSLLKDLGITKLEDQTGKELDFVIDPLTGLLNLGTPLTLPEGEKTVLNLVFSPTTQGPIDATLKLIEAGTNTVIKEVPVAGQAHNCSFLPTTLATENDDVLTDPTPEDDVVCGLGGNDTIKETLGGKDIFIGGPGNDKLNVKDGAKSDVASGGSGKDTCTKDKKDKKVNCGKKGKRG